MFAQSRGLMPAPPPFQMGATLVLSKQAEPFPQEGELSRV